MKTNPSYVYSYAGRPVVTVKNAPVEVVDGCAEIAMFGDLFLSVALKVPGVVAPQAFILDVSREEPELFESNESAIRQFLGHLFTLFCRTRTPGRQAVQDLGKILAKLEETLASVGIRVSAFEQFQQLVGGIPWTK